MCKLYAYEFSITFNAKKSIFLVFKGVEAIASICMYVNGDKIEKSECADHFSHRISTNDNESMSKSAIHSFWKYFIMFMCDFGRTYSFVKRKLFKIYCCSFYGFYMDQQSKIYVLQVCKEDYLS